MDTVVVAPRAREAALRLVTPPVDEFDARWATWIAKGRIHEQRVRRRAAVAAVAVFVTACAGGVILSWWQP